jgi:hypothetical protein
MISDSYIHEQMAAAHHRDLLEAAEHARLVAQARQHHRMRQRSFLRRRPPRPRMSIEPRGRASPDVRATTPPIATR